MDKRHMVSVLFYLQHGLLLGARLEVALLAVHPFPLLRRVVVEVDILHPKVLLVFHLVLIRRSPIGPNDSERLRMMYEGL